MGQFKPMVKMKTTEPSVILKLKKGGSVADPKKMAMGGPMGTSLPPKPKVGPIVNRLPTKPSRPVANPVSRPPVKPRGPGGAPMSALEDMKGLTPARMKHGGEMESPKMHAKEMKSISNLDKKLSKHADMPASKGHKGLKTGGVVKGQGGYKTGGVVNGQGGFKDGGAAKKHYATGGSVESGAPVAMPERKKSAPVAIDRLAGTFKKGGKVRGGMAC